MTADYCSFTMFTVDNFGFSSLKNYTLLSVSKHGKCTIQNECWRVILTLQNVFITTVYFRQGALPYIASSCLHGLLHMNHAGMAHLDVKPGNIGYDSNGHVKLVSITKLTFFQPVLHSILRGIT